MRIQSIVVGYLGTNCYILGDETTGACAVIDPGASAGAILGKIREMGLKAETILLTHGHYDHIMAVPELVRQTGARVCIHKKDQWLLDCDEVLRYGTRADPGKPGHSGAPYSGAHGGVLLLCVRRRPVQRRHPLPRELRPHRPGNGGHGGYVPLSRPPGGAGGQLPGLPRPHELHQPGL